MKLERTSIKAPLSPRKQLLAHVMQLNPWWRRYGLLLFVALSLSLQGCSRRNWHESSRGSAGIAPLPVEFSDAVVMAFRARLWGMRGIFADHTWVATKGKDAPEYTVYEVIGWRMGRYGSVVRIANDVPDRYWFGATPIALVDIRGTDAEKLVTKIDEAARSYPFPKEYRAFPGPNSNTFTAWIGQKVPELQMKLPARAVGKNYL